MKIITPNGNTFSEHKVATPLPEIVMPRLFATFFIGFIFVSSVNAQNFGVSAGANFQRLSDITLKSATKEVKAKFESQTGWHVGVWVELPLGPGALRAGGRYMAAGQLFDGIRDDSNSIEDNFDVSLVELYMLLRLGIPSQVVSPYVFAGPVYRIPAKTDKVISSEVKALSSFAIEIGGGLKIDLGAISLYPEIAYTFGLTRFIENELVRQAITYQIGDPQKLNMVMIRLSVGL